MKLLTHNRFAAVKPCNTTDHPVIIWECLCNLCGTEAQKPPKTLHIWERTTQHLHSRFCIYAEKVSQELNTYPCSDPTHKQTFILPTLLVLTLRNARALQPTSSWMLPLTSPIFPATWNACFPQLVRHFQVIASRKPLSAPGHLRKISKNCSNSSAHHTALKLG